MHHQPGIFHAFTLDTDVHIDINGVEHVVARMDYGHAQMTLLWLLRNAERFRSVYMRKVQGVPNPTINSNSQQWMLDRLLVKSLMLRICAEGLHR